MIDPLTHSGSSIERALLRNRRAAYRITYNEDRREQLAAEYGRLMEHELTQGLDEQELARLRQVEVQLDQLDYEDANAIAALSSAKMETRRLRTLNQIVEQLKAQL